MNKTVLLAEDDATISDLLFFWLTKRGIKVVRAANGVEAVEQARRHAPDLLLIDLQMPLVDGMGAARQIRQEGALCRTPIVFITAHGHKGIELFGGIESLGDGPIEYLTKPIDFELLSHLLTELL